jgi:predicted  nucleic acid-binding Zn-ribbon protein
MGRLFAFFQKDKRAEIEQDIEKLEEKKAKLIADIEAEINANYERLDKLESKNKSGN